MNLKQLEAFVYVAEGGSFSKAAKELYLTQPTVSAHIASLEKELEARVFVRNTKEVNLSKDGQVLYKYARQIIDLEKRIEDEFVSHKKAGKTCITIAASTIPAQYLLPKILAQFNERFPDEQLKIMETDSAEVIEQIINQAADIGFTGTVLEKKHCKYVPFYKDDLVLITPNTAKYRGYQKNQDQTEWIRKEAFIMREEGSGTRKEAEKKLKELDIKPESLNIVATIENQETIKRSVSREVGISILSKLAVEDEVRSGKVLAFPIPVTDGGRDINVVYNRNYKLSISAEKFLKIVKEVYKI